MSVDALCLLSISYSIYLFANWGKRWCVPPVVMYMVMADDIIYQEISRTPPYGEGSNSHHEPSGVEFIAGAVSWRVYVDE